MTRPPRPWSRLKTGDALAAEYRQALADFINMRDDGTIADAPAEQGDRMGTHSAGSWSFGPRHYECALNEIKRLAALQAAPSPSVVGEREAVKQAIHDWVREDAPINQKMTWTPALNTALENRILAALAPSPSAEKLPEAVDHARKNLLIRFSRTRLTPDVSVDANDLSAVLDYLAQAKGSV